MHRNEICYALVCINNHVLSCLISMLSPLIDDTSSIREKQEVIVSERREHCSSLTKNEAILFMPKMEEENHANSTGLILSLLWGLITEFLGSQEILKIQNPIKCIGSSFPNLSKISAKLSWILSDAVNDLSGMILIQEKFNPFALTPSLMLNKNHSWKMYIAIQLIKIALMLRFFMRYPNYKLGRSLIYLKIIWKGQYHQYTFEERELPQSISTLKKNLNLLKQVDLDLNGFVRVHMIRNLNLHLQSMAHSFPRIMRTRCCWISFQRSFRRSSTIGFACLNEVDEKNAVRPIPGLYQVHIMPIKRTSLLSMIIQLNWAWKLYIDSKKYCFVKSHVMFHGYVINPQSRTVKGNIKMSRDLMTLTSMYQVQSYYGLASFCPRHIKKFVSNVPTTT